LSLPEFAEAERLSAGATIDFGAIQVNFYKVFKAQTIARGKSRAVEKSWRRSRLLTCWSSIPGLDVWICLAVASEMARSGASLPAGARPFGIVWLSRLGLFCFGRHVPSRDACPLPQKLNAATFSNGVIRRRPISEGFLLFTTNLQPVNNWLTAMGDNGY